MPIRPEMRSRYPADWPAIREAIRTRAGNRCERCGVPNRVWVVREVLFGRIVANTWRAASTKREAIQLKMQWVLAVYQTSGELVKLSDPTEIVCTVAHTPDPTPENCDPGNLEFLCQCCHLAEDRPLREERRRERKRTILAPCCHSGGHE